MKKYLNLFAFLVLFGAVISLNSCKDDDDKKLQRPDCDIVEFTIPSLNITGVVDKETKTVSFNVTPDYDMNKLKNVAPNIQISPKATITPDATTPQDFTADVKYTVKAEDGTIKEWAIKRIIDKYVSKGIGDVVPGWKKNMTEAGLSANAEATLGVLGNELIMGRSGVILDAKTGEKKADKLNMPAVNVPFTVANDDAGNFIGCNLGDLDATKPFTILRWTDSKQAPVEIISYPQSATSKFGRKLVAVGDITKAAIITSYNNGNDNIKGDALHTYWKISNGTAAAAQTVATKFNSADIHQMLTPASATAITPYYFSDRGASNASPMTTVKYVDATGTAKEIKGPVPASDITGTGNEMFKETGWGRKVLFTKVFNFNGVKYLAVLSYFDVETTANYYLTIMDTEQDFKVIKYYKTTYTGQAFGTLNVNATAGLAVSKEEVGTDNKAKSMRIYALLTSSGVVSYEISNEAK